MVVLKKQKYLTINSKPLRNIGYKVSNIPFFGLNTKYRVRGSTLMETLVATVLIVVVFMLASMILQNLFSNTINKSTHAIENHLNELQYLHLHDQIELPYSDTYRNWKVSIDSYQENSQYFIEFEANNTKTSQTISFIEDAEH